MTDNVQERTPEGILVLDRDADSRRRVGQMLTEAGYRCSYAAGLVEGQARLAESAHGLAICTVQGDTGRDVETIVELQRPPAGLAVVVCVDPAQPVSAEVALEYGAIGYLVKPIDRDPLLVAVAAALGRRQAERSARRTENEARPALGARRGPPLAAGDGPPALPRDRTARRRYRPARPPDRRARLATRGMARARP
jgi:DNA-binding NtrC family response regulator